MMNMAFLFFLISLGLDCLWGKKTLVSVVAVTAHGEVDEERELTDDGMKHCYNIGKSLRKKYGGDFFSFEDYEVFANHENEFFFFGACARARTRESIQNYLQGAFNTTFKPLKNATQIFIPIIVTSKIKRERCDTPQPKTQKPPPPVKAVLEANRADLVDFQKKIDTERPNLLNHLTVDRLNTLRIQHIQLKKPLPEGIDEKQFEKLVEVHSQLEKLEHPYAESTHCDPVAGDFIHKVFFEYPQTIMTSIDSCQPPPPPPPPPSPWNLPPKPAPNSSYTASKFLSTRVAPPRYTHYSAYTSTVLDRLGCLGFDFTTTFPSYASILLVEIYVEENGINNQCVKDPNPSSPEAVSFRILYDLAPSNELNLSEFVPKQCKGASPCPAPVFTAPYQALEKSYRSGEYQKEYCYFEDQGVWL